MSTPPARTMAMTTMTCRVVEAMVTAKDVVLCPVHHCLDKSFWVSFHAVSQRNRSDKVGGSFMGLSYHNEAVLPPVHQPLKETVDTIGPGRDKVVRPPEEHLRLVVEHIVNQRVVIVHSPVRTLGERRKLPELGVAEDEECWSWRFY